ncbi:Sulfatase [Rosistilla oblonga]|uniref:sulfatase family protein n=1 Tax=Rosistilla oblonga TaxID=2527990 RepID=UPI001189968C|nr:sulfatase [Rosistilla oblonga]QDV14972.1 Sulfatase [Rosistilla oblonga]
MKRVLTPLACAVLLACQVASAADRPNIMVLISDDVSWPHASAYGSKMVSTPAFDAIAKQGVLFNNAICPSPGCSPSRAAFLTGRQTWMIEHAGTHASYFSPEYETFPIRLADAGYFVGHTGKGWAPGDWKTLGGKRDPCGPKFQAKPAKGESRYAAGFRSFLEQRPDGQPFCFWFGSTDAHRPYKFGSGLAKGMKLEEAEVPGYLPDSPEIRSDLLDYAFEAERFDDDCATMMQMIRDAGEFENTIFIVTSDNGMPFPRAKANCYEHGIHVPLAISWPGHFPAGRTSDDLVGFVDIAATIYEASGVVPPPAKPLSGKSMLAMLQSQKSGIIEPQRTEVFSARERHSSSRFNSLGYPQRAIRTHQYLYIRNFRPERLPAGPAQKYDSVTYDAAGKPVDAQLGDAHGGYHDIDACPSLDFLIEKRDDPKFGKFLGLSVDLRPREELFDIQRDPDCLHNLATDPEFESVRKDLHKRLTQHLETTGDARQIDGGDIWEMYPRVSPLRWFPEPQWAKEHLDRVPIQGWVEERRPR